MNFKELLLNAKTGCGSAVSEISNMYKPLMIKEAIIAGILDEDLYQEIWLTLLTCIKKFQV